MKRCLFLFSLLFSFSTAAWSGTDIGVLVMAHGGSPKWNQIVLETVQNAQIPYLTRVYFGMAHTREEVDLLQKEIRSMERKGARRIIVVPLLISSYSEVYRQWRYLLGKDVNPGFNMGFFPITHRAEIEFSDPFNNDPIIALVLLDRVREISQTPDQESVILVAHGPNDEADNVKWLATLRGLCTVLRERGGFKHVEGMTLRDDATEEVRERAIAYMRRRVQAITNEGGRALVIPLLIASGGIENKIGIALKGLDYSLNGKTLLPDDRISQWIRSKAP